MNSFSQNLSFTASFSDQKFLCHQATVRIFKKLILNMSSMHSFSIFPAVGGHFFSSPLMICQLLHRLFFSIQGSVRWQQVLFETRQNLVAPTFVGPILNERQIMHVNFKKIYISMLNRILD